MSIINDMLRDLEDRDAPETPARPVRRPLAGTRGRAFGWTVGSLVVLGSALALSIGSEPVRRWAEAWHMSRFAALPISVQEGVASLAGIDVASPPPLSEATDQPGTTPRPEIRSLVFEGDRNQVRIEIDVLGALPSEPYPLLSDRQLEIVIAGAAISPAFDPIAIPLGDAPWLQGLDLVERDDGVVVRVKLSDAVDVRTQLIHREQGARIAFSLSHPRALPPARDPPPLARLPAVSAFALRDDLPGIPAPPMQRRRLTPRGAIVAVSYPDADTPTGANAPTGADLQRDAAPERRMTRTPREPDGAERAAAAYHQARIRLGEGDSAGATTLLEQALREDPDHAAARAVLARAWIAEGRRDAAKQILSEGRGRGAITTFGIRLLAGLLADEGRSTEALEVLSGSGVDAIDSPDHHALQATLLQDLGRHDDAAATWRNVLKLDSRRADAWMGMGLSLEALGRKEQAYTAYRAALRVGGLAEPPARWVEGRVKALAP